ncbi:bifunctional purine biosynthesis protein PurH [Candidatus Magnetominusculus xianensis]|uniref:Bifunctional purine biosynthesis protein PurH n=1 Tax=Candidatus Magnetominusculus xianensis TaxID=1748249 RepID=A0ABR5SHR1_9BACT|nr:IMP cyclohydrolase [Candidatus Magnetominusculus xianensis]KWT90130.1 bifunctional purine biosynthesis protein PurH [Candidatus Magnetominusculus xianensis]MBF0403624.1 IMP cyclohydrolase [Nitrospirota bacterium]
MSKIENAVISVSDKTGVVEFAKRLQEMGVKIFSTGGTAKSLRDAGVAATEISEYTGFPEMLDGRVKTLHPKVHGGILARRDNPADMTVIAAHGIKTIDLVVVNLYPFEKTVAKPGVTFDDAIENIDIGGPTMLRAAAKNFKDVAPVIDPADYDRIISEMSTSGGGLSYDFRFGLALKVFKVISGYDAAIANYLKTAK